MSEIVIDESLFASSDAVHAYLATELDFPPYYSANLDALNDCLGDLVEPCTFMVYLADGAPLEAGVAADGGFAAWFPKLVRSLLRASRDNEAIETFVHATSLSALGRLAACPGLAGLLSDDRFIVQAIIASIGQPGED